MSRKSDGTASFSSVGGATTSAVLLAIALSGCSIFSDDPRPNANLDVANAALVGGSPRVALQVAQNVLSKAPDDVPALLVRADALIQLGANQEAAVAYQHALKVDPKSVRAKLGVARLSLSNDPNEAARMFREILATEQSNVAALTDLGIALDLLGQHREAQTYYNRVLKDAPDNAAVKVNLALSLAMSGDGPSAVRLIEPLASNQYAPVKLRHNYAAILTMAGRRAEAAAILKADLSQDDTNQALAAYAGGRTTVSPAPVELDAPPAQIAEQPSVAPPASAPAAPLVAEAPVHMPPPAPRVVAAPPPPRPPALAAAPPPPPPPPPPVVAAAPPPAPPPVVAAVPPEQPAPRPATETAIAPPPAKVPDAPVMTTARTPVVATPAAAPPPSAAPPVQAMAPQAPAAPVATPHVITSAAPPAPVPVLTLLGVTELGPHVQLGAFDSEVAAKDEWDRLTLKKPDQFGEREAEITTVESNGRTFWRLRTWGFEDQAAAKSFCSRIRAATRRCLVFGA